MKKSFVLFVIILLFVQIISAQKQEKLEKKWLAKDIQLLKLIPNLLPPETQTKESFAKIFDDKSEEYEIEFDAKLLRNGNSGGYTQLWVSIYKFKGSIISYKISSETSRESWLLIKPYIIEAWNQNAQIPFQETDKGIFYEYKNEAVLQEYKNAISSYVGEMKPIEVQVDLKEAFEFLTAPFDFITVSNEGCGYGGETAKGRKMIDLFIRAGRVDLIENILKGYNQGGRVYAVIALLEMKKKGLKLTSETEQTIKKVIDLDIVVMSCSGCSGFMTTAKELLRLNKLI